MTFIPKAMQWLLCAGLCLLHLSSSSAENVLDSLTRVLRSSVPDSVAARTLNSVSEAYRYQGSFDSASLYGELALKKAESLLGSWKGARKEVADAHNNIGLVYWFQGNYPAALKYLELCLAQRKELKDDHGIAICYMNIGIIRGSQGNYADALTNHFASLRIMERINDQKGMANCYGNIGYVYSNQGQFAQALPYFERSKKIYETIGLVSGLGRSYNNIGNIYFMNKELPKAVDSYKEALRCYLSLGDKHGLVSCYNNIGSAFYAYGQLDSATRYHTKALNLSEQIGDPDGQATALIDLAATEVKRHKPGSAKALLQNALALGISIGSKEDIVSAYNVLAQADSLAGDFASQVAHYKMYILYRDSLQNEESHKKMLEQSMTYDFEKKELANKALQDQKDAIALEEKRKQRVITWAVSCGLLLMMVFALFILRSYRQKLKANKVITEQKKQVEVQKHLIEEKHKEITDSINYAERIQRSFLATQELLEDNLRDHFVFFRPKDVVSGDFYWASLTANGRFYLATADSTGHGVPGAIMSILNISCLENALKDGLDSPSSVLDHTRAGIISRLKKDGSPEGGKDGMDVSLICLEKGSMTMRYAAANNPVWVVREGNLIELDPDKMPVGKHDHDQVPFTTHAFELQKDDAVYALTDGMPDQFGGPKGKKFMYKRLKAFLSGIADKSMNMQKELLAAELDSWKGDLEQVDDITIVGFRL